MLFSSAVEPGAGARERILQAASELFYRQGIHAIGIDTVIEQASVAKASLYKHFRSKDELAAAVLRRRDERWRAWLEESVRSKTTDPKARILAVFDTLGEWFVTEDFRGCGFINAAAEFPDPSHAVRIAVREHKQAVRDYLQSLAEDIGAVDPIELAGRLFLLMEGAIVTAYLEGSAQPAEDARSSAAALVSYLVPGAE